VGPAREVHRARIETTASRTRRSKPNRHGPYMGAPPARAGCQYDKDRRSADAMQKHAEGARLQVAASTTEAMFGANESAKAESGPDGIEQLGPEWCPTEWVWVRESNPRHELGRQLRGAGRSLFRRRTAKSEPIFQARGRTVKHISNGHQIGSRGSANWKDTHDGSRDHRTRISDRFWRCGTDRRIRRAYR